MFKRSLILCAALFCASVKTLSCAEKLAGEVLIADDTRFLYDWAFKKYGEDPQINVTPIFGYGAKIYCAVIVTGLTADKSGKYGYTVDMTVKKPDGTIIFFNPGYCRGEGRLDSKNKINASAAEPFYEIVLDKDKPDGIYKVIADIKDLASGKSSSVESTLELSGKTGPGMHKILADKVLNNLDLLWKEYYLKKNKETLEEIIKYLDYTDQDHTVESIVRETAEKTMIGNAQDNNYVLNFYVSEMEKSAGAVKKNLKRIIKKVKKKAHYAR